MRLFSIPAVLLACVIVSVVGGAEGAAAVRMPLGLHNARIDANFFVVPAKLYSGWLQRTELFEVVRLSASGKYALGHPWGERRRWGWISASALDPSAPRAPEGTTEVAGPSGSRIFEPARDLTCRDTNFLTVGVRLRGGRSGRVDVVRGGHVVERSRVLRGTGLVADQIRVPCDGDARVRYTVDGRSRSFSVRVSKG